MTVDGFTLDDLAFPVVGAAGLEGFTLDGLAFPVATVASGATVSTWLYRRRDDLRRLFGRRAAELSRVFREYTRMSAAIGYDTRVKDASETILFVFDYSRFPEVVAGETLSAPEIDPVAGLTLGTAAVLAEDTVVDPHGTVVRAGKGVSVSVSGGTADATYALEVRATTSGGSVRVVKGELKVE